MFRIIIFKPRGVVATTARVRHKDIHRASAKVFNYARSQRESVRMTVLLLGVPMELVVVVRVTAGQPSLS